MEKKLNEKYGINEEAPDLIGEDSLNPQNEMSDVFPLENINIDANYFSVFELKRKYDRTKKQNENEDEYSKENKKNQIILDSEFQREDVWNDTQRSELIESVLMGLPIPVMYLFEDKYANLIVVDGRQRLTSFFRFLDNKFKLKGLKILKDLNDKDFDSIDPVYQSKLEDYQLITQVIKPPTPDVIKFQMFDRVNRGGITLNKQEMRNALYQGNATKLLKRLSQSKAFKNATQNSLKEKRMKDKYLILRSIAFKLYFDNELVDTTGRHIEYKGDMDEFLGRVMQYLNCISEEKLEQIELDFEIAMENSLRIFEDNAFRLNKPGSDKKSPINMNVFESMVYVLSKLGSREHSDSTVKDIYETLISDENFLDNIANHRDSMKKYDERFELVMKAFSEVIRHD